MKDFDYVNQRVAAMTTKELAKLSELSDVSYSAICALRWPRAGTKPNPTINTLSSLAKVLRENRVIDTSEPSAVLKAIAQKRAIRRKQTSTY